MAERRELKKKIRVAGTEDKETLVQRCKDLEDKIRDEKHKEVNQTIWKNIQTVEENGGIDSGAFWDFKKKDVLMGNQRLKT